MNKKFLSIALLVGSLQVPTISAGLKSKQSGAQARYEQQEDTLIEDNRNGGMGEDEEEGANFLTTRGDIEQRPMSRKDFQEELEASKLRGAEDGGEMPTRYARPENGAVDWEGPGRMTDERPERPIGKDGARFTDVKGKIGEVMFSGPRLPWSEIYLNYSNWDQMLVKAVKPNDKKLLEKFANIDMTKELADKILTKVNNKTKRGSVTPEKLTEQETEFMYAIRHLNWVCQEFQPKEYSREPREWRGGPARIGRRWNKEGGHGPVERPRQTVAEIEKEKAAYKKSLRTRRDEGRISERDNKATATSAKQTKSTAKKVKLDDSKTK